ncbi:MAG TPA: Ig-like domain-containing protein, partial [Puia sp.]|nr:Ig-like domain-containing protein [Puia sp.]
SQGVTFQGVRPDASGDIKVYVNATSTSAFAFISGLQVFAGSTGLGAPVVALTGPANGTILAEGGNLTITATASETTGSIAKVEFYADTIKIGEADAAPYTMTWVNPDPGSYQLTAKATDAIGTIATASVNVGVQSLNYFWSTTGNIATNGDSNFVGTVDTNRLSFRTNNVEHMSIGVNGTTTIGRANSEDTTNIHGLVSILDSGLLSEPPLTINANSVFSPWIQFINTNPGIGATIGTRYYNDSGLVAQFFSGSYHDAFTPNGYAFHLTSSGGFEFVAQQATNYISWGNNFKLLGGSEMIFYPHTGHLIIGSTTDSGNNKLQINGNTWTTGFTMPTGATEGYVLTSDANGNSSWQPGGSGHWQSITGGVYDSADNVGIGTSNTQGYKLAVNGAAIVTRVVVKPQNAWPDYVFGEHYRLPGLPEVGEYIHTHHHLPGIVSAEEVKEKGIDVAEQQAALLQKLEEHTLYLIDQNKQLAGQNQELNDQNTELKAQQEQLLQLAAYIARVEKEMESLKKENAQLKKAIGKRK